MNYDQAKYFLYWFAIRQGSRNHPGQIECNFCSQDDYVFADFEHDEMPNLTTALKPALEHMEAHHPSRFNEVALTPPPSDEEIQTAVESIKKVGSDG